MTDIATCPTCRQSLRVPPSLIGQRVKCPACTTDFDPVPPPAPDRRRDDEPPPRRGREDHDRRDRRDDYDDRPPRPRGEARPGKVQALAIMMLVGGIFSCVVAAVIALTTCGFGLLWPGTYLAIVTGILCIVKASALLGEGARHEGAPTAQAVMQIVCIINGDLVNLTLGIVELVMLNDPESRRYFRS
jgi:hypothetical protein